MFGKAIIFISEFQVVIACTCMGGKCGLHHRKRGFSATIPAVLITTGTPTRQWPCRRHLEVLHKRVRSHEFPILFTDLYISDICV